MIDWKVNGPMIVTWIDLPVAHNPHFKLAFGSHFETHEYVGALLPYSVGCSSILLLLALTQIFLTQLSYFEVE